MSLSKTQLTKSKSISPKKSRLSRVSTKSRKYPTKPQTRRVHKISSRIKAKSASQAPAEFIKSTTTSLKDAILRLTPMANEKFIPSTPKPERNAKNSSRK